MAAVKIGINGFGRIGRMVARGWVSRSEAELRLLASAHACGLAADDGVRAAEKTIRSGLDAGSDDPHPDPGHPRRT